MMNYIQTEYRTVTLEGMAEKYLLSVPYLSKYIKEKSGRTFKAILTDIKMQRAKSMLKSEGHTIETIADKVGYQSVEHFSRHFKKLYGISPAEYRRKNIE